MNIGCFLGKITQSDETNRWFSRYGALGCFTSFCIGKDPNLSEKVWSFKKFGPPVASLAFWPVPSWSQDLSNACNSLMIFGPTDLGEVGPIDSLPFDSSSVR